MEIGRESLVKAVFLTLFEEKKDGSVGDQLGLDWILIKIIKISII